MMFSPSVRTRSSLGWWPSKASVSTGARRDLLDPRLAGRPISAIAYSCGFGDLSGFNRAFKEANGVSPRELRNASATGG
jgi:AraC-like DNA-binding protein